MKRLPTRAWATLHPRYPYLPRRWNSAQSPVVSSVRASVEASVHQPDEPVIQLRGGTTFYRDFPQTGIANNPLFDLNSSGHDPAPVLRVPSATQECAELRRSIQQHWAIMGPGSTEFLHLLRGEYFASDPEARRYPFLATGKARHRTPDKALRYVGFADGDAGVQGTYLSARYESWREETDWTLRQYLTGQMSLNPLESEPTHNEELLKRVLSDLQLEKYIDMPFVNLSHGQARRARIAKALVEDPEVLLIDNPFFGLDPRTARSLSNLLHRLAVKNSPRIVMALAPQDSLPDWITHLAMFGQDGNRFHLLTMGDKECVRKDLFIWSNTFKRFTEKQLVNLKPSTTYGDLIPISDRGWQYKRLQRLDPELMSRAERMPLNDPFALMVMELLQELSIMNPVSSVQAQPRRHIKFGDPIIEMDGIKIEYDGKPVVGGWSPTPENPIPGMVWDVRRGERWGLFGSNGSGKTTLISLITSDHPQAYAQNLKLFGLPRLAEPGRPSISYFELQSRIGHTSPEVHSLFPRRLSVRAALESAWADTPLTKPILNTDRNDMVDSFLFFFESDLNPGFGPSVIRARQENLKYHKQLKVRPSLRDRLPPAAWASDLTFGSLSVAQQKLVLFLRALIKSPDLVILDEPFSGMPSLLRDKCLHFLESGFKPKPSTGSRRIHGCWNVWRLTDFSLLRTLSKCFSGLSDNQSLIITSHIQHDIPASLTHWMRLPGPDEQQRGGKPAQYNLRRQAFTSGAWDHIWRPRPESCDPWYHGEPGEKWVINYYFRSDNDKWAPREVDFLRQPENSLFSEGHGVEGGGRGGMGGE